MRRRVFIGLWGVLFPFSLSGVDLGFSQENHEKIDQNRLDHFSEKYPERPVLGDGSSTREFEPVPTLKIRGFGDFSFDLAHRNHAYESRFYLGSVNLLMTSQISPQLSLLGELSSYRDRYYLDVSNPAFSNSSYFEFQRFALKYTISDRLNVGVGKFHTALGYWNHAYHHGTWLQPSITRPEIYRFEFEGGILPDHSLGLEIYGFKVLNPVDVRYHLGISNGRGKKLWVSQNFKDENRSKALTLFFAVQPHDIEGLQLGGTFYLDAIPIDPSDPAQSYSIDERIFGGHLIYIRERFEFLAEFFQMYHSERITGRDFDTEGGYLQGNIKMPALISYYRYDFINFAEGDPVFLWFHLDIEKHTLGLRWDLFSWNALKFEVNQTKRQNEETSYGFTANTSFTF